MVITNINDAMPVQMSEKKNTLISVKPRTRPISRNCVKMVPWITGLIIAQYLRET